MEINTISRSEKIFVTLVNQQNIQGYQYSNSQTIVVEQTTIFGKRFFSRVIQLQVKVQCSLFVHRIAAMANHWVSVFGMWNLTSMMGYLRSSILKSKNSPIASPRPGKISSIAVAMSLIHCLRWTVSCISLACCSVEGLAVPWSVGCYCLGFRGRVVVEC